MNCSGTKGIGYNSVTCMMTRASNILAPPPGDQVIDDHFGRDLLSQGKFSLLESSSVPPKLIEGRRHCQPIPGQAVLPKDTDDASRFS